MKFYPGGFWGVLLFYIAIYAFSNYIICHYLPLEITSYSQLLSLINKDRNIFSLLNEPTFWNSIPGLIIKLFLEISLSGAVLLMGFVIFRIHVKFSKCILIVTYSHTVFLLSIWIGFIAIKLSDGKLVNDYFAKFPLLSVSHFFNVINKKTPASFLYFFQTISFFEILYWFILAFAISRIIKTGYNIGVKVVFTSYVPLLLLWLLLISFLALMNS